MQLSGHCDALYVSRKFITREESCRCTYFFLLPSTAIVPHRCCVDRGYLSTWSTFFLSLFSFSRHEFLSALERRGRKRIFDLSSPFGAAIEEILNENLGDVIVLEQATWNLWIFIKSFREEFQENHRLYRVFVHLVRYFCFIRSLNLKFRLKNSSRQLE